MCIAVPGKLISIEDDNGIVEFRGLRKKVFLAFVPEVKVGDFVLVHAGCAMEIIDENEANRTIEALIEWCNNEV